MGETLVDQMTFYGELLSNIEWIPYDLKSSLEDIKKYGLPEEITYFEQRAQLADNYINDLRDQYNSHKRCFNENPFAPGPTGFQPEIHRQNAQVCKDIQKAASERAAELRHANFRLER
jgi:hypothetical protein